jgi:hypothetical protein
MIPASANAHPLSPVHILGVLANAHPLLLSCVLVGFRPNISHVVVLEATPLFAVDGKFGSFVAG